MPAQTNKRYQLTWMEGTRRWRKKYKGKIHYFPVKKGQTKRESYGEAIRDWKELKKKIDAGQFENTDAFKQRDRMIKLLGSLRDTIAEMTPDDLANTSDPDFSFKYNRAAAWQWLEDEIQIYRQQIDDGVTEEIGDVADSRPTHEPWNDIPKSATTATAINEFLNRKMNETRGGLSVDRYDKLRLGLLGGKDRKGYIHFAIGNVDEAVTESSLQAFHDYLSAETETTMSAAHADSLLRIAKQFARYCWRNRLIENLPRNLDTLTISVPVSKITTFTMSEVKALLSKSSEKSKLYWLLMLNCGMGQADIANLQKGEVDLRKGRITRQRTKTKGAANVPEVCYPLWPETKKLLRKYESDHATLFLVAANGGKLLKKELVGGRLSKNDVIRSAFSRVKAKLVKAGKLREELTLKHLRKTASSTLDGHGEYARYAQHFLGHASRTVAERHYVLPSQERFDAAVKWLGQQLIRKAVG